MEIPVQCGQIFKRAANCWEKLLLNICSETSQRCLTSLHTWPFGHGGPPTELLPHFNLLRFGHKCIGYNPASACQMCLCTGLTLLTFYHLHWLSTVSSGSQKKKIIKHTKDAILINPAASQPLTSRRAPPPDALITAKSSTGDEKSAVAEMMVWQWGNLEKNSKKKNGQKKRRERGKIQGEGEQCT